MTRTSQPHYAIGVDIGGTSVRCGLVNSKGAILRGSHQMGEVDSKGPRQQILQDLAAPIQSLVSLAQEKELTVSAIGIGMCGPLDYEEGISLIRGVDKYESLYGVNLKTEFRKRLELPKSFPIEFEVDAWSFGRGEVWRGAGRGFRRVVVLTLGTGLGSCFLVDGVPYGDGPGIPPPFGWLGGLPHGHGILDDQVSRRGILNRYHSMSAKQGSSTEGEDVKDIARLALGGNSVCRKVFEEMGDLLGSGIVNHLKEFDAECLVLGGRISNAFPLFKKQLKGSLSEVRGLKSIRRAKSIRFAAIWGAARMAFEKLQSSGQHR